MRGRAHVYPKAHISTDEIIPARHRLTKDEARLAEHAMEGVDADFAMRVEKGDIVVAGEDFGCGPSREQAIWALRGAHVAAVVARSFGRIFFRDALNEVDLKEGLVRNLTKGEHYAFAPFTPFALEILEAGGLLPYVMRQTTGASSV
ncbi:MAG TPA: 3-isopropylmalate dehydratase [Candidatus Polarisedimenticolia bacterium]|nr:3-isopropylmalate dehydratase [Candidatus Polarisedimenticolia bacterium]